MKWIGFRPLLCTYRLNCARGTFWGWWDDTALQTQDSKFKPWRFEAEYATSRSRRLPTVLSFTSEWGRNIFGYFKPPWPGNEPRTLAWNAAVLTTTLGNIGLKWWRRHTMRRIPLSAPILLFILLLSIYVIDTSSKMLSFGVLLKQQTLGELMFNIKRPASSDSKWLPRA